MSKRTLSEVVDEITSRYEDAGQQYNVKQVEEETRAAYDRGEIIEDPIDVAIGKAVKRRDKASHQEADEGLLFDEYSFPRTLVIGAGERQPSRTGKLEHVLADQAVKQANKIHQDRSFLRLQERNLRVLPYLQAGLTVAEAVQRARGD
jgi:hypothetical protein